MLSPKALSRLLKALSSERRLKILRLLLDSADPLTTSTIASLMELPLEGSQTSSNLTALAQEGLVLRTQDGRWAFYTANRELLHEIFQFFESKET